MDLAPQGRKDLAQPLPGVRGALQRLFPAHRTVWSATARRSKTGFPAWRGNKHRHGRSDACRSRNVAYVGSPSSLASRKAYKRHQDRLSDFLLLYLCHCFFLVCESLKMPFGVTAMTLACSLSSPTRSSARPVAQRKTLGFPRLTRRTFRQPLMPDTIR
jgi:hypothetical protein